jgi:diadenosine tetraphosphate (Ap4A) HIT family hydrolase
MSSLFRTHETQAAYEVHRREQDGALCPLCTMQSLKEFSFWKILVNDFPYDRIADVHHMCVPHRHVVEGELTEEERAEFTEIKRSTLLMNYDYLIETCASCKSLPGHFHVHLIVAKDGEVD